MTAGPTCRNSSSESVRCDAHKLGAVNSLKQLHRVTGRSSSNSEAKKSLKSRKVGDCMSPQRFVGDGEAFSLPGKPSFTPCHWEMGAYLSVSNLKYL